MSIAERYARVETDDDQELAFVLDAMVAFQAEYTDLRDVDVRAPLALELAAGLRAQLGQPRLPYRLRTAAQLDAIEWQAWNDLWFYGSASQTAPNGPAARAIRGQEFAARERLFDDIEEYDLGYGEGQAAYDELADSLHQARLLVKNPQGLAASENAIDRQALDQNLATYRTVKALQQSGYPKARRAVLPEKQRRIDVVIPLGKRQARAVALRLQPGIQSYGRLSTEQMNRLLLVNAPYESGSGNPFLMSAPDQETLHADVKQVRGQMLRFSSEVAVKIVR